MTFTEGDIVVTTAYITDYPAGSIGTIVWSFVSAENLYTVNFYGLPAVDGNRVISGKKLRLANGLDIAMQEAAKNTLDGTR